ncbi:MAG: TRAP transporter substrate-binding protein [Betaproteobacteria bacterium]|nr:TRAP transporter substrate-binding protein [Betaproteobacteria bacterium]
MSRYLKPLVCAALVGIVAALPARAAEFTAKLGSQDPPTTAKHRGLLKAAELVKQRTKGAVEIQVFPSSQLGGAREMAEGIQLGTLEAMIAPASFLGGFNPAVSIFDVPYIFPSDRAKSRQLRDGPFGQAVLQSFSKRGFEPIALWSGGRKQFTSNKPLDDLGAFSGQRFRVMDSKILIKQFDALGASAIVLPFGELYTSLQNGVIEGQENPRDIIQKMKFFEVQKNLLVTDHGAIVEVILFNPKWFARLPAAHREVIKVAFREVAPEVEQGKAADAAKSLEFFKTTGINVRIADEAERAKLRAMVYPASRDAYIAQAGDEGKALIELYEKELQAVNK